MLKRIASNAVANAALGATAAFYGIGMTSLIARWGTPNDLALWALAAAMAGLAPLISCNLAAAVARRIIAGDHVHQHCGEVVVAALAIARQLTGVGLLIAVAVGISLPWIYPAIAGSPAWPASIAAISVFAGSCWVIMAQPRQGQWMAAHNNWPIVLAGLVARGAALIIAVGLVVSGSPIWLALTVSSAAMWLGVVTSRYGLPVSTMPVVNVEPERSRLTSLLKGFAAWGATSALIQAATLPVVALVSPAAATPFYLAFTLVTLVIGLVAAAGNALVTPVARVINSADEAAILRATTRSTVVLTVMANGCLLVVWWLLPTLLPLWVGTKAADESVVRFWMALLSVQHGLRSVAIAASIVLSMGSDSKSMVRATLVEAIAAFTFALPMAATLGASGLMIGLVLAAFVASLWTIRSALKAVVLARSNLPHVFLGAALQVIVLLVWGPLVVASWPAY